jgi:hypothetical protein
MKNENGGAEKRELNSLHDNFAKKLALYLHEGETVVQGGKTHKVSCSAALLNVIRGFLKDNHVECASGLPSAQVGTLGRALDEFNTAANDEDEAPHFDS